jgi:hypothetical protein
VGCLLQLLASDEPRKEGLIAGMAALAQSSEFVEGRLLGFRLSGFRAGAHRFLTLRSDGALKPEYQFVPDGLRTRYRGCCQIRILG